MMMPGEHEGAMHDDAMHGDAMHDMKPTGNVDADFARTMMMHDKMMMAMAKVEVACGKDAKAKALAQKQLDQATADDAILQQVMSNYRF